MMYRDCLSLYFLKEILKHFYLLHFVCSIKIVCKFGPHPVNETLKTTKNKLINKTLYRDYRFFIRATEIKQNKEQRILLI